MQLPLADRKALAARILNLLLQRKLADLAADRPDSANFAQVVQQQIDSVRRADPLDDPWSLDDFLDTFRQEVQKHTSGYDDPLYDQVRAILVPKGPHFGCSVCVEEADDMKCKDVTGDRYLLGHNDGGLCLRFLKGLVERFARVAETTYAEIVGDLPDTPHLIPELSLGTSKQTNPAATLPVDGAFMQPSEPDAAAEMEIIWPITDDGFVDLDAAILSLPYLVFHEVFVHGAQGAACEGPRFLVDMDCAFTEGTVDCVAYDILSKHILPVDENVPELLKPLRNEFNRAGDEYNLARMKPPALGSNRPGDDVRRSRYFGRIKLLEFLDELANEVLKFDAPPWVRKLVLTLNLYMTPDQREEFFEILCKARERKALAITLFDPMNAFLEHRDVARMLTDLQRASGIKTQTDQKRIDFLGNCI
ncbi:MAG: hypothetical protein AB3N09_03635 [Tateyamaria sp.]